LIKDFPADLTTLQEVEPVYEEYPGWLSSTTGARTWEDLPANARTYLVRLAELMGVGLDMVSVSPAREATIVRKSII
jgi:adenylosuccinate synthase